MNGSESTAKESGLFTKILGSLRTQDQTRDHFGGVYPGGGTTTSKSEPFTLRSSSCITGMR